MVISTEIRCARSPTYKTATRRTNALKSSIRIRKRYVARRPKGEHAGMAEQADAYVLETYANSVRVQVSLPAPFKQNEMCGLLT